MLRRLSALARGCSRADLVWFGAIIAAAAFGLGFLPVGHISAINTHPMLLDEFGRGVPIAQTFDVRADGLRAISVHLSSTAPAHVLLEYHLSIARGAEPAAEVRRATQAVDVAGSQWVSLEFPEIERTSGTTCVLTLRALNVQASDDTSPVSVSIAASRDRPTGHGYLTVGDQDRWGTLEFEATANGETLFERLRLRTFAQMPDELRRMPLIGVALVLYGLLFLPLIAMLRSSASSPAIVSKTRHAAFGAAVCVVLVCALAAIPWIVRAERTRIRLIDEMHAAEIQTAGQLHFYVEVLNMDIDVHAPRALFAHSPTRVVWRLTLPPNARLRTAATLGSAVWASDGDGVVFRIFVNDAGTTNELFSRHVDPFHEVRDRRWFPVDLDLSRFAERPISLIFATEPSLPGLPPDNKHDWALWAEPRIDE